MNALNFFNQVVLGFAAVLSVSNYFIYMTYVKRRIQRLEMLAWMAQLKPKEEEEQAATLRHPVHPSVVYTGKVKQVAPNLYRSVP